ncbi:MAG TPA: glycosyltransferase family 4 protein [Thermomicrobiales bacterium]|nr:glycosyltransferase family 4 protein [Thermomicrobiales bacterium]
MRIAQIAPLAERVPPELYGGTERVVATLTAELVRRGHDVTLFASGDSLTAAPVDAVTERALRGAGAVADPLAYALLELGRAFARADQFDVIHSHLDYYALPFACLVRTPVLTTLHGRLDLPDLPAVFAECPGAPLASISDAQRAPLPWANWAATVYNGIDLAPYPFAPRPGDYFAFLGRISPEKNPEGAIVIARRTGIPLKIAAKVDDTDRDFYEARVKPLIDGRRVEYVGEIGEGDKGAFLGGALALLFPVVWPEPFGLALVEAMACGTPVLASRCGAVPEVVADGETGFLGDTLDELVAAASHLGELDRRRCRDWVETRFSGSAMADGYEAVYRHLVAAADPA